MSHHDRNASDRRAVVIGAGPAGLTAAYEMVRAEGGPVPVVLEAGTRMGGISRTEEHNGYRFDIGGHRFFTKVPEVEAMWHEVLGGEFITRPRLSRIYYRGKFFDYPLKLFNALGNIGPYEASRIILSYAKWRVRPSQSEDSFEEWVINRFGGRLYMHFFRSYTEKVWGIDPKDIRADWAAQRIKNLSLPKAVWNAMTGANDTASLIEEFQYPRLGPGMMWDETARIVTEAGGTVETRAPVTKVIRDGLRVTAVEVTSYEGETRRVGGDVFFNSMDLRSLIHAFDPPPPPEVIEAADRLRYRDFLIVTLVLNRADPFPDNWIYVHEPGVKVGRIQNFRAWSPDMLPDPDTASIGMEYFCQEGDGLWAMDDDALRALAAEEIAKIGLAAAEDVTGAFVIRQPKAYPVYDTQYAEALEVVSGWLKQFENFQTAGRNGLHRYNNQDHSMLSAMLAARNLMGEDHDVWSVNVERSYHEEFEREKDARDEAAARMAAQ